MYLNINHNYNYQVVTTIQIFYPNLKLKNTEQHQYEETEYLFESLIIDNVAVAKLSKNNEDIAGCEVEILEDEKYSVKKSLFLMLKDYVGVTPSWGMLTGVRPAKNIVSLIDKGMTLEEIPNYLEEEFYVKRDKIDLAIKVALVEKEIIKNNKDEEYSLYVGIPFCKTRCTYCSFTSYSHDVYKKRGHVDTYVENLVKEIELLKGFDKSRVLKSLYIGGGTPTSISASQLELIMKTLKETFDLRELDEYTVEAGRVDTIDKDKLEVIKKYGTTRLSVNAQTMSDETLVKINRSHTKQDFLDVYNLAREIGFDNINVDVIVGLPDETVEDVKNTLREIVEIKPENITIHTLSYKRGSDLTKTLKLTDINDFYHIGEMLESAKNIVEESEYKPYYMYRQKNMSGQANAENVGYSLGENYGIYNIQMMEEKQHIISCGAGVATKIIFREEDRLEKFYGLKTVEEYNSRFDEMMSKKAKFLEQLED